MSSYVGKFYLNRISFAVVIAKCLGGHYFGSGTHCIMYIQNVMKEDIYAG